jgi:hypothetical protein
VPAAVVFFLGDDRNVELEHGHGDGSCLAG